MLSFNYQKFKGLDRAEESPVHHVSKFVPRRQRRTRVSVLSAAGHVGHGDGHLKDKKETWVLDKKKKDKKTRRWTHKRQKETWVMDTWKRIEYTKQWTDWTPKKDKQGNGEWFKSTK